MSRNRKNKQQPRSNLDNEGRTPAQQRALQEMKGHLRDRVSLMPAKRIKQLRHEGSITKQLTKELLGIKERSNAT